jgi:hypothetical protein
MDLVRDVLDKRLVDRHDRPLGRVDGIVLSVGSDGPPRVMHVEAGILSAARRLHPALARRIHRVAARWSPVSLAPVRLSPSTFRRLGVDIEVDLDSRTDRRLLRVEKWLARIVGRIPGAGS